MRAVIQRVMSASVTVDGAVISSIGRGLCVLIGVSRDDTVKDMEYIVRKVLNLRLFDGDDGKRWGKSVADKEFEILCVSQFTLYAVLKGNKPDFHQSMASEQSQAFYEQFLTTLRSKYKPELVKDGQFGAYMQVNIQNDGPVTITLDSGSQFVCEIQSNPREVHAALKNTTAADGNETKRTADNQPASTVNRQQHVPPSTQPSENHTDS